MSSNHSYVVFLAFAVSSFKLNGDTLWESRLPCLYLLLFIIGLLLVLCVCVRACFSHLVASNLRVISR